MISLIDSSLGVSPQDFVFLSMNRWIKRLNNFCDLHEGQTLIIMLISCTRFTMFLLVYKYTLRHCLGYKERTQPFHIWRYSVGIEVKTSRRDFYIVIDLESFD